VSECANVGGGRVVSLEVTPAERDALSRVRHMSGYQSERRDPGGAGATCYRADREARVRRGRQAGRRGGRGGVAWRPQNGPFTPAATKPKPPPPKKKSTYQREGGVCLVLTRHEASLSDMRGLHPASLEISQADNLAWRASGSRL